MGTVTMVGFNQTKDAVERGSLSQVFLGASQTPAAQCMLLHQHTAGRFHFCRFVRGSNRFSTTWPIIETEADHCGYGECATRVQGAFQRCVQSVSGPSLLRAQTDRMVETGATVNPSLPGPKRGSGGKEKVRVLCASNLGRSA